MAGDVGGFEECVVTPSGDGGRRRGIAPDVPQGDVLHRYGSQVAVLAAPPGATADTGPDTSTARTADDTARRRLGEGERLGLAAFELRTSAAYLERKAARPRQGAAWDGGDGAAVPGCVRLPTIPPARLEAAGPAGDTAPTSARLSGTVAVGLVLVEGPDADLQFDDDERALVAAETQNGLTWLGGRHPVKPVTWSWDVHVIRLAVAADPAAPDLEAHWRDPVLAELGYAPGIPGVTAYVHDLRSTLGTDWAYAAFFTKYPVGHFAYALLGGPYLVMQYGNDGWGPENIDRVFAHETGHVFNAPDEYGAANCNCGGGWGHHGRPNGNCANCAAGGGVDCLMKGNTWAMCDHTPFHLGFPMCPTGVGVQFRGMVPAYSTGHWRLPDWPADCHVVWSVVPMAVRPGGGRIRWDVRAERASTGAVTYWLSVANPNPAPADVEARYAVLGGT